MIDPAHSAVTFSVRHLMSKVRGRFTDLDGRIDVGPTLERCAVVASVRTSSVDTGTAMRDDDLRSDRFFGADAFPRCPSPAPRSRPATAASPWSAT